MASSNSDPAFQQQLQELRKYTACDISDALLRVQSTPPTQLPLAGFLADIHPLHPAATTKLVAPASTLKYISKFPGSSTSTPNPAPLPSDHPSAIPADKHWVDLTPAGTIVVIEAPPKASAASIGGIMSLRMATNGVLGCVVSGRVRDVKEHAESGIEVWTAGRSTVATGAEAKVWGRECEIVVKGVTVRPGDVVFADGEEGCVVVVPRGLVGEVLEVVGGIVEDDERVMAALKEGMSVKEAFAKFRGKSKKWAS